MAVTIVDLMIFDCRFVGDRRLLIRDWSGPCPWRRPDYVQSTFINHQSTTNQQSTIAQSTMI